MRYELGHDSLTQNKTLNGVGRASVSIPNVETAGMSCCEILADTEPYRDELILYRGKELAFAGPVTPRPTVGLDGGKINAPDLFHWMDVRFLEEDLHSDGDVAGIFRAVFEQAYEKDDSPNISISTRDTGIDAVRDFRGVEFRRAADVLRELARTGVDFTMDGRRLLAGGTEVFLSTDTLVLHDDGCISVEVQPEGDTFATDVAVFGNTAEAGGTPISGRATRSTSVYGLVQRSFTELTIKDRISADANALARLEAMQPAPLRLKVELSENAAFGFGDLIPGRRIDVRLKRAAGCIEVNQVMRLQSVDVSVQTADNTQEKVSIQLVPLGVSEAA